MTDDRLNLVIVLGLAASILALVHVPIWLSVGVCVVQLSLFGHYVIDRIWDRR